MTDRDQRRYFEITAVVLTGIGKFIFMDWLDVKLIFIISAILSWTVYVLYRKRQHPDALTYWGFTRKRFYETFMDLLPYAAICTTVFFLIGYYTERSILNWSILPILLLYPVWGVIQQFLVVGLIGKNLNDIESFRLPFTVVVLITAVFFGIVHYPHWLLVLGTFLLAIVYTTLYLNGRNLLVLGIYHGWLGAVFFYTVLGRDCWEEVFAVF